MRIQWPISKIKARSIVDMLIIHTTSSSYEIPNKTWLFFAESVRNPYMHYDGL